MCCIIAEAFINNDVEVVIGPETGGIIISRYTAMELSHLLDRNIPTTYANKSKDAKSFFITSDFIQMIAGKNVLVVEDNITTGGSVRQVVEAVRKAGGHVVGVGVLCKNKTITKKDLADVPKLFSIIERAVELYPPEKCPLCGLGIPVNTEHGHGKEFLENQKFTGKFKD